MFSSASALSAAFGQGFAHGTPALEPDVRREQGPGLRSGRPGMWPSSWAETRTV
ncbi:hypothetical protein SUDANB15_06945 [Streptomyces sp. enrichment culture]